MTALKADHYPERHTVSHLHQAGVLVGREAIDAVLPLWALHLQEAGEAALDVVGPGDLLLPVIHVDLQRLQVGTGDRAGLGAVVKGHI